MTTGGRAELPEFCSNLTIFGYQADLARERERHLPTARAVQIPKYGQIRTQSRLFVLREPSSNDVPVV